MNPFGIGPPFDFDGIGFNASPIPQYIDLPKDPSAAFQKEFFDYVAKFCRESAEFVRVYTTKLERFRKLYYGELTLHEWRDYAHPQSSDNKITAFGDSEDENAWASNYVHPIAPYCNTAIFNAFLSIFSGPEWVVVTSESLDSAVTDPATMPTQYKIQHLLLSLLKKGGVSSAIMRALRDYVAYGTVVGKVFWHSHTIQKWRWNTQTFEQEPYEDIVYEAPIFQAIPLNLWLPDIQATHTDVQRWRGVGNRVIKPYAEVLASFNNGVYRLNKQDFIDRFEGGTMAYGYDAGALDHDPVADSITDQPRGVMLWEWHGRIPTKGGGLVECCGTIATGAGDESPESGVLIRCTTQPVYASGLRPYVVAHYTPQPGPFGVGMVEENEENFYLLSMFLCQIQDVARRQGNAAYTCLKDSPAWQWFNDYGTIKPGDVVPVDRHDDVAAAPSPNSDVGVIKEAAIHIMGVIERLTGITDTFSGVAGRDITATHASILERQSQAPASVRTQIFCTDILEPLCNHALALIQQYTLQDQQIVIRDYDGVDRPILVSLDEIQQGKFAARVALTNQDATSIARAQIFERILQQAPMLKQIMITEGKDISVSELFQRLLDATQIGGTDRVIRQVQQPPPMMGPDGMPMPGQIPGQPPDMGGQLVTDGGPMGAEPTDANAMSQFLQLQGQALQGQMP